MRHMLQSLILCGFMQIMTFKHIWLLHLFIMQFDADNKFNQLLVYNSSGVIFAKLIAPAAAQSLKL